LFSKAFSKRLYDKKWSSALMSTLPLPACFEMVRSKKTIFVEKKPSVLDTIKLFPAVINTAAVL
jgi:hypothetical protein